MNARDEPGRVALLIVGLGNVLMRDDGVGVHAARELQRTLPAAVRVVEVGTALLDALHLLESARRVLALDAVAAGGVPGTIYRIELDPRWRAPSRTSLHELDLRAALRLLQPKRQPAVTVLGIEPELIEYGLQLSPTVQEVFPAFLEIVESVAMDLLSSSAASCDSALALRHRARSTDS